MHVPTVSGWYNSQQTFRPIYLTGCDVEVNPKFDVDRSWLQRPSEMDVGQLPGGHSWSFQPEGMCIGFKSLIHVCVGVLEYWRTGPEHHAVLWRIPLGSIPLCDIGAHWGRLT